MESENPDANPAVIAGAFVHIEFDGVCVSFDEVRHTEALGRLIALCPYTTLWTAQLTFAVVNRDIQLGISIEVLRLDGKFLFHREGPVRGYFELAVVVAVVIMVDVTNNLTRLDGVGGLRRNFLHHSGAFSFRRERSRTQGQAENCHQDQSQGFLKITHEFYLHKTVASHICPLRIPKISNTHNEFATIKNTYVAGSNFNTLNNLCQ